MVLLLGCAVMAGLGCDSHIPLGTFSPEVPNVLWSATFEPGDLSEWEQDGDGNVIKENAAASPTVSGDLAHNGRFSGKATVGPTSGSPGMSSSNYFYRTQPSPTEAYYGAWFYIPSTVTIRSWLSLVHFRCSATGDGLNITAVWDLNLWPVRDGSLPTGTLPIGSLTTHFYNFLTQVNADQVVIPAVPTDQWVHYEVLIRKAADATGRIQIWQDDVLIVDLENIATFSTDWVEWDVGGASNDLAPASASVYVDDATISLERLGSAAIFNERAQP